jgi:hypothetical protein
MATALKLRSDINKLKKALQTKGISDSVKSKLKNQLERAESELDTIKKTGKAPKRSSVKSTKTALTALQKLVNRKKYSVYKGAGVDLEKDAGQGALATGRRISKGLKANQNGDKGSNKGNVYYEYRPNHLDVKQPKKKQTYPKLERGGMMADGGRIANDKQKFGLKILESLKGFNDGQTLNGVLELLGYSQYRFGKYATESQVNEVKNQLDILIKMGYVEESGIGYKITKEGSNFLNMFDYGSYAQGGMMADGGNIIKGKRYISHWSRTNGEKNYDFLEIVDTNAISSSASYFGKVVKYKVFDSSDKSRIGKIEEITKDNLKKLLKYHVWESYADGGYMADGGDTKGKNGYVAFYKGKRIEVYADTMYEAQLKAAKIFNAKKSYDVNVVLAEVGGKQYINSTMASGGYMADGGEIIDPEELYKKLSNAESKFNEDGGAEYRRVKEQISENRKRYFDRLDKSESKWSEDGGAEYKSLMKMRDKFMKGGYMAKGGKVPSTYIPNEDIKELMVTLNNKSLKLKGSDILDGVYVKNSALKGGSLDYSKQTSDDFELGEIVWDVDNIRYGTIIGIYDQYASDKFEVRLDTDGMQPTENLRKVGSEGDNGTKEQLKEEIDGYARLVKSYPKNNYPKQIEPISHSKSNSKGGDLSSIKKKYEENEDENAHSENVVLLAKHFGTKEDLAKAKEILALHEKEGSLSSENGKKRQELHLKLIGKARAEMSKQGIEFEKGGYMAEGGIISKTHKLG